MQRHISTFTSADEIAAHLTAGHTIEMPHRRSKPFDYEDVIRDIPEVEYRIATIACIADEAWAGRILREALKAAINSAAIELYREHVAKEDVA